MSTLANKRLTMVELAHRKDPDGSLAAIAEVLTEDNEIWYDIPWAEANDTYSHKVTRRASEPSGTWVGISEGPAIESSKTVEAVETLGILESRSENDVKLIDAFPDPIQARNDEAMSFVDGLSKTFIETLIYGNIGTTVRSFNGFFTRLSSLATTTNVLDGGGDGSDTCSILVVQWGLNKIWCAYPKGHANFGVDHEDVGIESVVDINGTNKFRAYVDLFKINGGLVVKDTRCYGRIANIESTGTTNLFDEDDLIRLLNRMPSRGAGAVIYMNETLLTQAEIRLKDKTNVNWMPGKGEGLAGEPFMYFRGNPVRKVDQMTITETVIT